MTEHPILFSPAMVRAILEGRKSQTRRVVKHREYGIPLDFYDGMFWFEAGEAVTMDCPYGVRGDRLWVKESWRMGKPQDNRSPSQTWEHLKNKGQGITVLYECGGWKDTAPFERPNLKYPDDEAMPKWAGKKRSSMFMPRWASRITLDITDVRLQRVQDISHEDCEAEGLRVLKAEHVIHAGNSKIDDLIYADSFHKLWDSINAKKHPWSENPLVWAISFRRVNK